MLKSIACYLSGRHQYGVSCRSGAIYLECAHCGKRSSGWSIELKTQLGAAKAATPMTKSRGKPSRVLPFDRAVAN
ncbi:MAG TPA: hypothetical protein VKH42_08500 [Vicinamibacterales bacterium]|nr:hypothetical protein [Vicinamibacterales bacterium]